MRWKHPHSTILALGWARAKARLGPQERFEYIVTACFQDVLDQVRLASARSSPTSEAIDRLINVRTQVCATHLFFIPHQFVDEAVAVELVPKLSEMLRKAIGSATKVRHMHSCICLF